MRGLLAIIPTLFLAACNANSVGGTLRDYKKCMDQAKGSLGDYAAEQFCKDKNQRDLQIEVNGNAKYLNELLFEGSVNNTSKRHVITAFTIHIAHPKYEIEKDFEDMWIEPSNQRGFSISIDKSLDKYRPGPKDYTWRITKIKGLVIDY